MFALSASSEDQLIAPLRQAHGLVEKQRIEVAGRQILALTFDTASGPSRKNLLLSARRSAREPWLMLLFRATSSAAIVLKREPDPLLAFSKAGKPLSALPLASLDLRFGATGQ